MTPYKCTVKHDPQNGFYGDCVRVCLASILDMEPDAVPHAYQDGCDADTADKRIDTFLHDLGLGLFRAYYPGDAELQTVLNHVGYSLSPGTHYMLFCNVQESGHVVICEGNKIVFDPAWYVVRDYKPLSNMLWMVAVLVKQ